MILKKCFQILFYSLVKLRKELDLIIIQKVDTGENKELKQTTLDRREMKDLVTQYKYGPR